MAGCRLHACVVNRFLSFAARHESFEGEQADNWLFCVYIMAFYTLHLIDAGFPGLSARHCTSCRDLLSRVSNPLDLTATILPSPVAAPAGVTLLLAVSRSSGIRS